MPSIIIILILLSVLYAQFSTQIAIIVLSLGIVSTIIIFLFCKFDTIHNFSQKDFLFTYILYLFLFLAVYLFKYPIYNFEEYGNFQIGIQKAFFYVLQMLGVMIAAIGFILSPLGIASDILKKRSKFRPLPCGAIFLGLLSLIVTSGLLMKVIYSMQQ